MGDCEVCASPTNVLVILAKRRETGELNTLACPECAVVSGAFCTEHNSPHIGFNDGTTACDQCVEEVFWAHKPQAKQLADRLMMKLPPEVSWQFLKEAKERADLCSLELSIVVLRLLAVKAVRSQITVDDVVAQLVADRSVDKLFW